MTAYDTLCEPTEEEQLEAEAEKLRRQWEEEDAFIHSQRCMQSGCSEMADQNIQSSPLLKPIYLCRQHADEALRTDRP